MTTNSILRLTAVMQRTGLSRSTIYAFIKDGRLKPPISLGARAVGWLNADIDEFIDSCINASRKANEVQA